MASWLHDPPEAPAETLTERLARTRDLAGPRRPGDSFGQGGWSHHFTAMAPPQPPSAWLVALPFIVLAVVAVAVTLTVLMLGAPA